MPPALREARGAFRRERPPRTLLRAPGWHAAARWPARAVVARLHRCSSRTPTRPFVRSLFTSAFEAACACTTSASACLRGHDRGPLKHPRSPGKATGTTAELGRRSPFDPGQSPKVLRVRGRGQPCLDTPHRDCSRWRLRPDPDRFGPPLVASIHPSSPVRSDVGREGCRRRRARLQSVRGERVVRRPPSAKKTCAHQPEGPSVARPLAMRAGRSSCAWPEPGTGVTPAPFSPSSEPVRGTLARVLDGSAFAQGEWRTTLVGDGPQRP
jgi:hypothetical protein